MINYVSLGHYLRSMNLGGRNSRAGAILPRSLNLHRWEDKAKEMQTDHRLPFPAQVNPAWALPGESDECVTLCCWMHAHTADAIWK